MADAESVENNVVVEEKAVFDNITAIQKVIKNALVHDGLKIGIREVIKSIESKEAKVCFLSNVCSEPAYKKLVTALCAEKQIPLFMIDNDSKDLGQWSGLFKVDKEGNARKIIGASSVAVIDFGEESAERDFLMSQKPTAAAA
ncbi:40S ribosomal protein S12, putative [Plasmodium chabaudi chabaudi]|uniref:40S ribosomal protein S12 n=4 Tax=Plasmodium (Vinckeia) TaxID=418101 RepID=A0A077TI23_PLACU|nr:40S ribosomal protein S12, putative [Plasmodium vinckei vinckei]XP_746161.1 40S ribosomal protein S12, putative [Plasmodium chabaudi chabaudi]CAD2086087.1 40S ribosomal protein S12, putative [Plasmodium vinckei lentum]SCM01347.1 40S ribosomal protein S12, putative [Plasmodium chabaudi adami]KEG01101.1 40S ribosomal protein S12 [Plasmodium vinckei vinckei]SCL98182.1 40S ribosomal protein S12, putative [Plasmodium chabaudi chabaudi]SCL98765.1 40S ribosomal protein S12, putative [Plasmodium c|eukprot:XP_746161.1 40S ribosomal protein S12, putative [Plasmodium chabaudi chabaudi]